MEELTPIQNQALCLLAAGYNKQEVASRTEINTRTLARWEKEPNFKKKLKEAVAKTYDSTIAELVAGSREAAKKLKNIIDDPDVPSRVKVTAIQVLLNNAAKAKESLLEERLENLEDMIDGDNQNETEES